VRPLAAALALLVAAAPLGAQSAADRLDTVAEDLEGIVLDLEASQAQTAELRARLSELETLSAEHRTALGAQDRLLAGYRASVDALEAHDRASLTVALELRQQLESERRLSGWLWPVAGAAIALAVLEGVALGWRR